RRSIKMQIIFFNKLRNWTSFHTYLIRIMIECAKVNYKYDNLIIHISYLYSNMEIFKKVLLFLLLFSITQNYSHAQKKLWNHPIIKKLTSSTKDSTRSPSLLFLPALGYAQETGLEFGATGIYNFYADKTDSLIYSSTINAIGTFTTEKQLNLKLESDIWTRNNKLHYISALRYRNYPFNYYGLGDNTLATNKTLLVQKYF